MLDCALSWFIRVVVISSPNDHFDVFSENSTNVMRKSGRSLLQITEGAGNVKNAIYSCVHSSGGAQLVNNPG